MDQVSEARETYHASITLPPPHEYRPPDCLPEQSAPQPCLSRCRWPQARHIHHPRQGGSCSWTVGSQPTPWACPHRSPRSGHCLPSPGGSPSALSTGFPAAKLGSCHSHLSPGIAVMRDGEGWAQKVRDLMEKEEGWVPGCLRVEISCLLSLLPKVFLQEHSLIRKAHESHWIEGQGEIPLHYWKSSSGLPSHFAFSPQTDC